ERIKQAAWQNIILSREAQKQKIQISDDEVRTEILRLLQASKIVDPTPEVYQRWLQSALRETPRDFEKKVREYLRIQKLIKRVNAEVLETPNDTEIRTRTQQHHAKVAFKMAVFPTIMEIFDLQSKIKNIEDWGKQLGINTGNVQSVELASLDEISEANKIPMSALWGIYLAPIGTVSDPFQTGDQYAIALTMEKAPADESILTENLKKKYAEELSEQKRFERFMRWNSELIQRAALKDYLPSSESPETEEKPGNEPPPPPAPETAQELPAN
ncbi:MAG: hypothetical protein WC352_05920, partial [Candidatus Omnitrophota bacterium]